MESKNKIYRIRIHNLKTKLKMVTGIEFRKETDAKAWVKNWKSQGKPFDADYIEELNG